MSHFITDRCTGCAACVRICPVNAISGQKRQRHAVNSRVCVDCGACGLVCTSAALVDDDGAVCRFVRRLQWPKPVFLTALCVSCGACVQACPAGCLDWSPPRDADRQVIPVLVAPRACVACAFCRQACPVGAVEMAAVPAFA